MGEQGGVLVSSENMSVLAQEIARLRQGLGDATSVAGSLRRELEVEQKRKARFERFIDIQGELIEKLASAISQTVDYVGYEVLPAMEGWAWYDALSKADANLAEEHRLAYTATLEDKGTEPDEPEPEEETYKDLVVTRCWYCGAIVDATMLKEHGDSHRRAG